MRRLFLIIAILAGPAFGRELKLATWLKTHQDFRVTATLLRLLEQRGMTARVLSPSAQFPELHHARITNDATGATVFEADLAITAGQLGDRHNGVDEPTNVRAQQVTVTAAILADLVASHVPNVANLGYETATIATVIEVFLGQGKLLNLGIARQPHDSVAIEGALPVVSPVEWAVSRNEVLANIIEVAAGLNEMSGLAQALADFQATEVLLRQNSILAVGAPHWRFTVAGRKVLDPYSHTLTYGYAFPRHLSGLETLRLQAGADHFRVQGLLDGNPVARTQLEAAWRIARALQPGLTKLEIAYTDYSAGVEHPRVVADPIPVPTTTDCARNIIHH